MIHVDGEPYAHDRLVYLGYEMDVSPPIELQQEVEPPYADAVIIRYLAEKYGVSEVELASTAQSIGDRLDRLGLLSDRVRPGARERMKDIIQEWLPDHTVSMR